MKTSTAMKKPEASSAMSSRIAAATISPIAAAMTWATTVTSSRITGCGASRGGADRHACEHDGRPAWSATRSRRRGPRRSLARARRAPLTAAAQAGVADCEAHDGGLFAQDVNAWTSLALVAVGLVIVVPRRAADGCRVAFLGLAVAIVAGGVGSVLYHGDPGDTSQLVHDGSLVASAGFVAGWHVGRLRSGRTGVTAGVGLVSGLAAGVVGASTSAVVTDAFVAIAIVAIAISEVVAQAPAAARP